MTEQFFGTCQRCFNITEIGNSCCNRGVIFEGQTYQDHQIEDLRKQKLQQEAMIYADAVSAAYADVRAAWSIAFDGYRSGAMRGKK